MPLSSMSPRASAETPGPSASSVECEIWIRPGTLDASSRLATFTVCPQTS